MLKLRKWQIENWYLGRRDDFYRWVAYWVPRELVYWCVVRAWAKATSGKWANVEAPGVTAHELLQRLRTEEGGE